MPCLISDPIGSFEQYFDNYLQKHRWQRLFRLKLRKRQVELAQHFQAAVDEHDQIMEKVEEDINSLAQLAQQPAPVSSASQDQEFRPFLRDPLDVNAYSPFHLVQTEPRATLHYNEENRNNTFVRIYRTNILPMEQILLFPSRYFVEDPVATDLPCWVFIVKPNYGLFDLNVFGDLWALPPPFPFVTLRELDASNGIQFLYPYRKPGFHLYSDTLCFQQRIRVVPPKSPVSIFNPLTPPWLQHSSLLEGILKHQSSLLCQLNFEEPKGNGYGQDDDFHYVYLRNLADLSDIGPGDPLPKEESSDHPTSQFTDTSTDEQSNCGSTSQTTRNATIKEFDEYKKPLNLRGGGNDKVQKKRRPLDSGYERDCPTDESIYNSNGETSSANRRWEPRRDVDNTSTNTDRRNRLSTLRFLWPGGCLRKVSRIHYPSRSASGPEESSETTQNPPTVKKEQVDRSEKPRIIPRQERVHYVRRWIHKPHRSPSPVPIPIQKHYEIREWLYKIAEAEKEDHLLSPRPKQGQYIKNLLLQLKPEYFHVSTYILSDCESRVQSDNYSLENTSITMSASGPLDKVSPLSDETVSSSSKPKTTKFLTDHIFDMIIEQQYQFTKYGLSRDTKYTLADVAAMISIPSIQVLSIQFEDTDTPNLEAALEHATKSIRREAFLTKSIHQSPKPMLDEILAKIETRLKELGHSSDARSKMKAPAKVKLFMDSYSIPSPKHRSDFSVTLFEHTDFSNKNWTVSLTFEWRTKLLEFEAVLRDHLIGTCQKMGFKQAFTVMDGPWVVEIVNSKGLAIGKSRTFVKDEDDYRFLLRTLQRCRGNKSYKQPPSIFIHHAKMIDIQTAKENAEKEKCDSLASEPCFEGTSPLTDEDYDRLVDSGIGGDGFMGCPFSNEATHETTPMMQDLSSLFP